MDPFDMPPTTLPVSSEPPAPIPSRRSTLRTALVAFAAAGLVGAGIVGVSQLASVDRPEVVASGAVVSDEGGALSSTAVDDADGAGGDVPDGSSDDGDLDGRIVIDTGDGDPMVIDLGGATIFGESIDELLDCVDLTFPLGGPPFDGGMFDGPFGLPDGLPLGDLSLLGDGTHITVVGPDGITVIELGEADGSVTITSRDGDVTITTDGDATVRDFADMFDDMIGEPPIADGEPSDGPWSSGAFDPSQIFDCLSGVHRD